MKEARRQMQADLQDDPQLRVLGSLVLRSNGQDLEFGRSSRLRKVLAVLVIHRGELVSIDRLAEIAWGRSQPSDPRAAIHNLISRLRTLLGTVDGLEVVTRPPGYILNAARNALDSAVAEDWIHSARLVSEPAEAARQLSAALSLWRGPAYAEFMDEDFARIEAARLNALRQLAREDRVSRLLAAGANDEAISDLESIVADEPLWERPREQLMIALYRSGRVAEALSSYRSYRTALDEELGLEPSELLTDLERRILQRDRSLALPVGNAVVQEPAADAAMTTAVSATVGREPSPRASFVGRDADLRVAEDLLRARPVLTLVGVGGVGKTHLAWRLTDRVRDGYPDGIIHCDLAAITDPSQVADVLATAAGVIPESGQHLAQQLAETLSTRRSLLFLDNCEHVLPKTAELVERIIRRGGDIKILATSRERLGVDDEQVWTVDPLPVPVDDDLETESVQLFVARARAVNPSFEPAPALAELCRRLDGLPLAIELAAARTATMTVVEILHRLEGQSHLLRSDRPATPSRHQSLHSVVDWSYQLLNPVQKAIFDQLGVFPADFSLDAALGVVDVELPMPEVALAVLGLVDRSLVQHSAQRRRSRYTLLDTLRRYARSHLAERGYLEDLNDRHASWYLRLADTLGRSCGAGGSDWLRRLDEEIPNLRVVHRRQVERRDIPASLELMESLHYYARYSLSPEVFDWARDVIALPDAHDDPRVSAAYATAADGAWLSGDLEESRTLAGHGVALAEKSGHPAARYSLISLANALGSREIGEFEVRADLYRQAAVLAEDVQTEPHRIIAELARASCMLQSGHERDGREKAKGLSREARQLGSPDLVAKAELILADALLDVEPLEALSAYWCLAEDNRRTGNRYQEYQAVISAAFGELIYGEKHLAAVTFRSLLTQWSSLLRNAPLFAVLQGVVILLVHARAHLEAAVLSGAIPSEEGMIAFAVDRRITELLATSTSDAQRELGPSAFADAVRRGKRFDRDATLQFVFAALSLVTEQTASDG